MEALKNNRSKIRFLAVLVAFGMIVAAGVIFASAQAEERERLETQAAIAYQEANLAAVEVRDRQQDLAQELAAEFTEVQQAKASNLSSDYRAAYDLARAKPVLSAPTVSSLAATGSSTPVVSPTGSFQAWAYGYSGFDQIASWRAMNSDVIGWLRVPGTNISYPVVQNTSDVNYYTAKGYDKNYSYNGVIWTNPGTRTGTRSQISSNTVLYGHNWTNYSASPRIGSPSDVMFAQLTAYHHLSQAQSYPYFYYSTADEQMTFVIFACFYTEVSFQYNVAEGDMSYIIAEAQRRSRHSFGVDVNSSDKIVTLSTCTRAYGSTNNQRFVVMGRLLRPGETIDGIVVTANPTHKQPSVW